MAPQLNRQNALERVVSSREPFDVIIVGGGATGLGAAVDAASRGYRTLLVEQADFAKGTSSKSTKLVHGGVRYLKQGDFRLVLDALKERGLMRMNAPHLVHDLEFVIPAYSLGDRPFYGVGLKVYDAMARQWSFGKSRILSTKEVVNRIPTIEASGLRGGVVYHDGQFDDSRLAVNLAQTAAGMGACLLNYVRCLGIRKKEGKACGIEAVDEETGDLIQVEGRSVINATGVFVDDLIANDTGRESSLVAVSQGIHLVLPKRFLPGTTALMVPKTADGRVLFAIPWHDHVVIGTTDTPLREKTLDPCALEEERDFVMSHARRYLAADPTDGDVLSVFAGLRPLVRAGSQANTASLSRDHTILVGDSGMVTVTGGKWTTYRKMGEDVIDRAETVAGFSHKPSRTETLKVHAWTDECSEPYPLSIYGSDSGQLRRLLAESPGLEDPLHPELPYRKGEVLWHVRHEMARTVEDVLARRTRALLLNAAASIESAPAVASLMASELDRDQTWIKNQVKAFETFAGSYLFGHSLKSPAPVPI